MCFFVLAHFQVGKAYSGKLAGCIGIGSENVPAASIRRSDLSIAPLHVRNRIIS